MNTFSEAVAGRCSSKKVLLKILQYSKLKETLAQVLSCEYCEAFKNSFYRIPPIVVSAFFKK